MNDEDLEKLRKLIEDPNTSEETREAAKKLIEDELKLRGGLNDLLL